MQSKYLTTEEVAEWFRVKPQVIRRSRVLGILFCKPAPLFKKLGGNRVLYSRQEIERFDNDLSEQRITQG